MNNNNMILLLMLSRMQDSPDKKKNYSSQATQCCYGGEQTNIKDRYRQNVANSILSNLIELYSCLVETLQGPQADLVG